MISIRKELVEDCIENIRCLLNEIIELRYYGGNDMQCKIYEAEISELEAALQSHNSENTPCGNCGSTAGTHSMGEQCRSCHCET